MENEYCEFDFAKIERGVITAVSGGMYTVKSYGRDFDTPLLKALHTGASFSVGDSVFFFMFDDGDGRILDTF